MTAEYIARAIMAEARRDAHSARARMDRWLADEPPFPGAEGVCIDDLDGQTYEAMLDVVAEALDAEGC